MKPQRVLTPQLIALVQKQEQDKSYVLDFMLPNGNRRRLLDAHQWKQVYLRGDGIRNLDLRARPVNLDSLPVDIVNVTNATPEGFYQMARKIEDILRNL